MKNKSHISKWAVALCAIAVFSLSGTAYGGLRFPSPLPGPIIQPTAELPVIQPTRELPVIQPTAELPIKPRILPPLKLPVRVGAYTGVVIVD